MTDRLAALYPPETGQLLVVPRLPAPRFADPPPDEPIRTSVREFYGDTMLAEFQVPAGNRIAFIDKSFPHSRFDLMLLASEDDVHSSASSLTPATRRVVFSTAYQFLRFVGEPEVIERYGLHDGHVHVCFNYDEHTTDRENGMFYDKRFHTHVNYYPGRDLKALGSARRWRDLPDVGLRRRLIDPLTVLAASIMYDALGPTFADLDVMPVDDHRDSTTGLPPGLKFRLPHWRLLESPTFAHALALLHERSVEVYGQLHEAFTGQPHRPRAWHRPALLPPDDLLANIRRLDWLSERSAAGLRTLAAALRTVDDRQIAMLRHVERRRVQLLTLAGLNYSLGIFSPAANTVTTRLVDAKDVYVVVQYKLLADIGMAGLPAIRDIPIVKLDRRTGPVMSDDEVADRRAFSDEFLQAAMPTVASRFGLRASL